MKLKEKSLNPPNFKKAYIDKNVNVDRISDDRVTLYPGCRIVGESTFICRDVSLGQEAPVTVENCQIGPGARLKGGYFKDAVFLKNASMGSGAHVREGTILEEGASGAHTVGLKQTILFPYVTLGSLINFCDCLMAGGTGKDNHSEVGSSYIHFNFTPNQDKATASLMGDVPHGVMLDQAPIFLGGQGGLVGPSRLAYGTVIAAGSIYRKDELRPGRLLAAGNARGFSMPHTLGMYQSIRRIVFNNMFYISNLMALRAWYRTVRAAFISEEFPQALHEGLLSKADMAVAERIRQLELFAKKMPESIRMYQESAKENASSALIAQKKELIDRWPVLAAELEAAGKEAGEERLRDQFLEMISKGIQANGKDYLLVIKGLSKSEREIGTSWLQGIVDNIYSKIIDILKTFKKQ